MATWDTDPAASTNRAGPSWSGQFAHRERPPAGRSRQYLSGTSIIGGPDRSGLLVGAGDELGNGGD